jgi:GTPase SAR1 family protein
MGDQDLGQPPLVSLQSKDHEDLLNIIDTLRSQGISRYIDLPQLIVCGDQSSGKSSVLEAVSGIRFPTKDNLCTRFATELILRRGPATSASVTIVPNADRSASEKAKLLQFQHEIVDLSQFEKLVDKAKLVMGIEGDAKAFSNDILRVEVTSPNQPHLTLVDLPGLFSAGNKAQSDDDAKVVKSLVLSYMKKSRSIILAVVSAKNDFANQIVTRYARQFDPEGHRTLGIITKPDTLHAGSDSESSFVELARNRDVHFRLGWHVLRNRDYNTRHISAEERDEMERAFFSQGIWTSLPSNHVGISFLKPRLSALLKEQILTELPSLIEDVTKGVSDCNDILRRLGGSRSTLAEQRNHLLRISTEFSSLTKSAIDGTYEAEFFGSAMEDQGYQKRLRAVIQNTCLEFSKTMQRRGHAKQITDNSDDSDNSDNSDDSDDIDDFATNHNPKMISRADYIEEVMVLMKRSRGRELPGTYNPLIIGHLFYEQSKNWAEFVRHYTDSILNATRMTLNAILEKTADEATGEGIMRYIINPQMDILQRALEDMVTSVLEPHQRGHPITYNHYFTDNIQKAKAQHRENSLASKLWSFFGKNIEDKDTHVSPRPFDLQNLLEALSHETEADMDRYACSEAIDCMEAYYKVSLHYPFSALNSKVKPSKFPPVQIARLNFATGRKKKLCRRFRCACGGEMSSRTLAWYSVAKNHLRPGRIHHYTYCCRDPRIKTRTSPRQRKVEDSRVNACSSAQPSQAQTSR